MHSKNLIGFLLCILTALVLLSVESCSEMQAENTTETQALNIPEWLDRNPGVGSLEERNFIYETYTTQATVLKKDPENLEARLTLAQLYMNEARITGEHPHYYPAALEMLQGVLDRAPVGTDMRFQALSLKASVQLSLHNFAEALVTGNQARTLNPYNAGVYGVLVDANVELGQYVEAVKMSDKMVSIRPDLRSYSRISYLRELHGDFPGAVEAMQMAVSAGYPGYEETAWCRVTMGKLYETYGQIDLAAQEYRMTLVDRPDFPFALAGLASVEIKKGNLDQAEEYLDAAIKMVPEVGFYEMKATLVELRGEENQTEKIADQMLEMMQEDMVAGHNMSLELARVYLEMKNDPQTALQIALKEYHTRPANIEVNQLLASIYCAKGEFETAKTHVEVAKVTKSNNPALQCLDGLIEFQLGNAATGKAQIQEAFAANPYLKGRVAKRALELI